MNIQRICVKSGPNKKTFIYTNSKGVRILDAKTLSRIHKLVIPPMWENVFISENSLTHLQATGSDKKKRQYIYHPLWSELASHNKYVRMGIFCNNIDTFERKIVKDSSNITTPRIKLLSLMFRILQKTHIRVGNEQYAKMNKTYGLCTLEKKHICLNEKNYEVTFSFIGKKNIHQSISIKDKFIYNSLYTMLKNKNKKLFSVSPSELNNYLQETMGQDFTCKDFRTYASNLLFVDMLSKLPLPTDLKENKRNLVKAFSYTSHKLGHTPLISKKSYIMPHIYKQYETNPRVFYKKRPKILLKQLFKSY